MIEKLNPKALIAKFGYGSVGIFPSVQNKKGYIHLEQLNEQYKIGQLIDGFMTNDKKPCIVLEFNKTESIDTLIKNLEDLKRDMNG